MYLKAINPFLNAQVHITHQKSYLVAKYFIDTFSLALTTKILVSLLAISSSFCRNFTSGTFQNLYFTFVGKFLIFSKTSINFLKNEKFQNFVTILKRCGLSHFKIMEKFEFRSLYLSNEGFDIFVSHVKRSKTACHRDLVSRNFFRTYS